MDIQCIFCHSAIRIGNKAYILHLYQYHRIKFDMDHVINRTRDSLQVQKAKIYYSTMNSTVMEIVNDILEKVIGNPKTIPQFLKPVNESIEDINDNKFDNPHEDLSYLVSDKYGDNIDNPIDESCDDFDESDISDDYSESDLSDTSFLSLAEDHPLDESYDNFSDIINDDFNEHAVCDNLNKSYISDATLLKDLMDASPNKDYQFDHLNDGSCDYSKKLDISDTSLFTDYSELTEKPPKENDNMPAALREINFNCYIKIEDIKKESNKILERKLKEKRKHATAFSEELNTTGRRKSARLEVKTIQSSEDSQEKSKVMAEKSKVTEKKSKVTAENSKVIEEKSIFIAEKSKLTEGKSKHMEEKNKVFTVKNKVTAEKSKVIAEKSKPKITAGKSEEMDEIKKDDAEIKIEKADTDHILVEDVEKMQNTAMSNSKSIPWFHGTIYSCQLCTKQFVEKIGFKMHMEGEHSVSFEEVEEKSIQSNTHECEICGKGFSWYRHNISSHLTKRHNISLINYYEKFKDDIVLPNLHITDKTLLSRFNGFGLNSSPDHEWANQCTFHCALCNQEFNSKSKFGKHLRFQHQISIKEYKKDYGKSILHEEKHYCQIESCDTVIIWDKSSILGHIKNVHNLSSIEDYKEKYMNNYVEKATKNQAEEECMETDNYVEKATTNHEEEEIMKTDNDWSNKCTFTCALCQNEFNSRSKFVDHLRLKHKLPPKEYISKYGSSISHEEKHSCQVENCNSYIWWDRKIIKGHLYNRHAKMSIEEYESTYMNGYVEKTIDTISDQEWANKCTFQCAICKQEFNSKSKFGKHLKSNHQLSITEYTKDYGKSILHEEKHYCQIESCDTVIIWDKSSIVRHIKNVHDLSSIEDYTEKYMDNYVEKDTTNKVVEERIETDNEWFNKCTFTCALCQVQFNSHSRFGTHLKRWHEITVKEYSKDHGTSITHEERHNCQVEHCNANLWWDRQKIMQHLCGAHEKMSIDEYEKKFMSNNKYKPNNSDQPKQKQKKCDQPSSNIKASLWANRCIFKCGVCGYEAAPRRKLEKHLGVNHKMTIKDHAKQYGRIMSHEEKHSCQVDTCNSYLLWDISHISKHIHAKHEKMLLGEYKEKYMHNYEEKVTGPKLKTSIPSHIHDKYSECEFSCNICKPGKVFHSRIKAGTHMKTIHGVNLKEYKDKQGSSISFKINHTCHICAASLLWDRSAISNHMYKAHNKMSISEYFEKFIDNFEEDTEWLNKVTLKCKECDKKQMFSTKNRNALWKHVEKTHKKTETEYKSVHGSMYSPSLPESHTCQICLVKINWESISLKPHIEIKHEMTIKQYVAKFKDSYKKKKGNAPQKNANKTPSDVQTKVDKEVEDEEVLRWTTGSLHLCKICDKGVAGLHQFKKHLESGHNTDYKQYEKLHQLKDFLLFEGFHICTVCQKNIRHDLIYLQNHMKEHDMSVREYMDKYKPKPPKLYRMMKDRQEASVEKE